MKFKGFLKAAGFLFLHIILHAVFLSSLVGQEVTRTFRHITPSDGMANAFVWKIMQDRHGFIWVTGSGGLDRFDGHSVKRFVHDPLNSQSIPRGRVYSLLEEESGMMWVGADALALFDPGRETFKSILVPDSIPGLRTIWHIHKDEEGGLWTSASNGLYYFPNQDFLADTLKVSRYLIDTEEEEIINFLVVAPAGGNKLWVATSDGLYQFDKPSLTFVKAGPFDEAVEDVIHSESWSAMTDSRGDFWLATIRGLVLWRAGANNPELITRIGNGAVDLSGGNIQGLSEDSKGNIWIGTADVGAIRFNPENEAYLVLRAEEGNKQSIVEDDVHYIFEDREGGLWFGYHFNGISHYYEQVWNYTFLPLRPELEISHLANRWYFSGEDSQGHLWAGTGYGLMQMQPDGSERKIYVPYPELPMANNEIINKNTVRHFVFHEEKILLVTLANELFIFDTVTQRFEPISLEISGNMISNIAEDDKHFYLGSVNSGMIMIDKVSRAVSYFPNILNDLEKTEGTALIPYVDVDKTIWVISASFDPIKYDFYSFDPDTGLFSEKLHSGPEGISEFFRPVISSSEPGVLWSFHSYGMLKMDVLNGRNEWYLRSQAHLFGIRGIGLIEDANGILWTGHEGGMVKIDIIGGSVSIYEGDPGRRPGLFAFPLVLNNGDIMYGGTGGAVRFKPDKLFEDAPLDMVHITELRAGGHQFRPLYEAGKAYKLKHSDNNLNISYVAINYRSASVTRYRYRLLGHSDEWNEVGNQQSIFLANLPPGKYTFQLQASTPASGFTGKTAEVSIRIMPPWWRTMPAIIVFGLLLIAVVFGFDRMQRQRLIARERERTREKDLAQAREIEKAYEELKNTQSQLIQAEKMASLGELTAGIAHEIQNPLNFVNNFSELNKELISELRQEIEKGNLSDAGLILTDIDGNEDKIIFHGKRADSIVKGMLLHSRSNNGQKEPTDINVLADEYLRLAYHGLRARDKSFNASFSLEADPSLPKIRVVPQDMGRVLLNLINNAFQAVYEKSVSTDYQPTVTVSTKMEGSHVVIAIRDNGPGIPEEVKEKIFQPFFTTKPAGQGTGLGLSITYDIVVKGHGGTIDIESEKGKGTVFLVKIPV